MQIWAPPATGEQRDNHSSFCHLLQPHVPKNSYKNTPSISLNTFSLWNLKSAGSCYVQPCSVLTQQHEARESWVSAHPHPARSTTHNKQVVENRVSKGHFSARLVPCTGHTLSSQTQGMQDQLFPFENLGHK